MQTNTHVGRLTKPFEVKYVGDKKLARVDFCLAIPRAHNTKKTDFIYYVALGKRAELLAKYANETGQVLEISFEMQSANKPDANGKTHYYQNNVVTEFKTWGSKKANGGVTQSGVTDQDIEAALQEVEAVDQPTGNQNDFPFTYPYGEEI
ncbi:single-stranded DNA-binding protein [Weissella minor]|uniref:single-stranded DNA-binding protein n=1 Tax=Weissella minor TaxID=1620 RepID=UPI001BAEED86|nr:single-stranded DNA-binding protein [Weissella minor]MBS0949249.1 single-stranded DNA-binding protein [Weissella minor]